VSDVSFNAHHVSSAKILSQVENAAKNVTVEIFARPKGKDATNDALPNFFAQYIASKRVGSLVKETPSGKLVTEWQALVNESSTKPELVDMGPAISAFMSVKDEEELVGVTLFYVYILADISPRNGHKRLQL